MTRTSLPWSHQTSHRAHSIRDWRLSLKIAVLIVGLSYPTETVLSTKITRSRIVLSFKDSPRRPFGRRPCGEETNGMSGKKNNIYKLPDMTANSFLHQVRDEWLALADGNKTVTNSYSRFIWTYSFVKAKYTWVFVERNFGHYFPTDHEQHSMLSPANN